MYRESEPRSAAESGMLPQLQHCFHVPNRRRGENCLQIINGVWRVILRLIASAAGFHSVMTTACHKLVTPTGLSLSRRLQSEGVPVKV